MSGWFVLGYFISCAAGRACNIGDSVCLSVSLTVSVCVLQSFFLILKFLAIFFLNFKFGLSLSGTAAAELFRLIGL